MSNQPSQPPSRQNIWSQASNLAARTPESRNRYVDFLRAVSIFAVVFGHWLMAAPYVAEGGIQITSMLEHQQWTRWMTWVFQVMPVFFLVGGYSNGISWQSAQRKGQSYAQWLQVRLQRLAGPVLPLIVMWIVLAAGAQGLGLRPAMVKVASQMALIPVWFLAVYVFVVVLVPITYAAWQRYGFKSFGILVLAAVIDDLLFFAADFRALGWFNYAFVWLAVHQLGYAWRDGYMAGARQGLTWVIGGAVVLVGLITIGPYPVSMVSVPGQEISNTLPPKISMLALGIVQCGLLLSIETPMRRWLSRATPWTAVVLVNSMIMTVFLWHLTASTLVIGCALLFNDIGLEVIPGSKLWWAIRPVWLLVYLLALLPFALGFGRFERSSASHSTLPAWRLISGAILICAGLALLALDGVVGDGWFGLRVMVLLLPFAGALLAGVNPFRTKKKLMT
ncbi:acyltransferase [Pseudomonadota bacterium]